MSEDVPGADAPVRSQDFPTDGPVELDLAITAGRIEIALTDDPDSSTVVHAEIRHDPEAGSPWSQGMSSVLNWVNDQFGDQLGADLRGSPADAVAETTLEMVGSRLSVRAPKPLPLRHIPLAVTVRAPAGSHLKVKTGSAGVTVAGTANRVDVATGSGDVQIGDTQGAVTVRTGGGAVTIGSAPGTLQLRTGGGEVRVVSLTGSATVGTGHSGVWIGTMDGDVLARSGSGDLTVADAGAGSVELMTGSGQVRIGVRAGALAEIDLSSGSGSALSELDVMDTAPDGDVALRIRARTGSGRAVVTHALH